MRLLIAVLFLGLMFFAGPEPGHAEDQRQYFVVENGAQAGPYSLAELQARARAGQMTGQTLIWTGGMAQWTPAAQVPDVAQVLVQGGGVTPEAPRDLNKFLDGTWVVDPRQVPVQGVGVGTMSGQVSFQEIGGFTLEGVISGVYAQGLPFNIDLSATGTFTAQSTGQNSFRVVYEGSLSSTWRGLDPSVPGVPYVSKIQPETFEIIDENTIKDGEGNISRRQM